MRAKQRPKKAEAVNPGGILQSSKPVSESIVLTTEIKPIEALPASQGSPSTPDTQQPATLTINDFDEEDVTNAYGALLESGALMLADVEIELNEARIQKRGKQLYKIMKRYGLSFEYMDLMFVGIGVLGDCMNVYQQVKIAKKEKGEDIKKTEETAPPATTEEPQQGDDFKALQARVKI